MLAKVLPNLSLLLWGDVLEMKSHLVLALQTAPVEHLNLLDVEAEVIGRKLQALHDLVSHEILKLLDVIRGVALHLELQVEAFQGGWRRL